MAIRPQTSAHSVHLVRSPSIMAEPHESFKVDGDIVITEDCVGMEGVRVDVVSRDLIILSVETVRCGYKGRRH